MRVLLCLAALSLVLAGCASTPASTTTPTGTQEADPQHPGPKTVDVILKGNQFVNATVTLYEGDSIRWVHQDGRVGHSVTSDAGQTESFDSNPNCATAVLPPPACMVDGDTFTFTFMKAGTTKYHCRPHPGMTGTIEVLPHPDA